MLAYLKWHSSSVVGHKGNFPQTYDLYVSFRPFSLNHTRLLFHLFPRFCKIRAINDRSEKQKTSMEISS